MARFLCYFALLSTVSLAKPLHTTSKIKIDANKKSVSVIDKKIVPPSTKLNVQFGFNLVSGSAVVSGFQLGKLVYSKFPIYIGPELSFMLFSPGSVLNVLWGGWVESHLFANPKRTFDFGLYLGPGFSNQRPGWRTTNAEVLMDVSYTQEIDDTFSLRGQIRPGSFDGKVLCAFNLNVQFRFL
jgi:hypothetical protein